MADRVRAQQAAAAAPPSTTDLYARRVAAVALGIYLFASASPFAPVSWLTQSEWTTKLDGPNIIDRVLSPVALVGGAVLHWYIASIQSPLPLTVSVPGDNPAVATTVTLGVWLPGYFWPCAVAEAAVLWMLGNGRWVSDFAAHWAVVVLVVGVWVLGWNALPPYRKEQARVLIKEYVVRLVIMEMMDMAFGGGGNRRRRRRRL